MKHLNEWWNEKNYYLDLKWSYSSITFLFWFVTPYRRVICIQCFWGFNFPVISHWKKFKRDGLHFCMTHLYRSKTSCISITTGVLITVSKYVALVQQFNRKNVRKKLHFNYIYIYFYQQTFRLLSSAVKLLSYIFSITGSVFKIATVTIIEKIIFFSLTYLVSFCFINSKRFLSKELLIEMEICRRNYINRLNWIF